MNNHTEWPMFGPDPANTGHVERSGPRVAVSENWQFEQPIHTSPVVADEMLYVGDRSRPDEQSHVYAIGVDGNERWRYESGSINCPSLAIDGDVLIVCESIEHYDEDDFGLITALDRFTGSVKWQVETADVIYSAPTVVDGTVFVGCHDNDLYAIDISSGTVEWQFKTNSDIFTTPSVSNGTVYVGSGRKDGHIYAVDAETGREQWRFKTGEHKDSASKDEGGVFNAIPVNNGIVYAGAHDERLYALDAGSGIEKWHFKAEGIINSSPAVTDDTVFFSTSDDLLYAVNADDGTQVWKAEVPTSQDARPIVSEDSLFIGAGILRAFDTNNGAELWKFKPARGTPWPAIIGGTMYVGSGNLHSLGW